MRIAATRFFSVGSDRHSRPSRLSGISILDFPAGCSIHPPFRESPCVCKDMFWTGSRALAQNGAPNSSDLKAVSVNHVTLRVADVRRSTKFYQEVFGMTLTKASLTVNVLQIDTHCFLGIEAARERGFRRGSLLPRCYELQRRGRGGQTEEEGHRIQGWKGRAQIQRSRRDSDTVGRTGLRP